MCDVLRLCSLWYPLVCTEVAAVGRCTPLMCGMMKWTKQWASLMSAVILHENDESTLRCGACFLYGLTVSA